MSGMIIPLAITGPRGAGGSWIANRVVEKFKPALPESHRDWTLVFLEPNNLPKPFLNGSDIKRQHARAKLFCNWGGFYGHLIDNYFPVLERVTRGEKIIALFDGFGLDALINALAYTSCPQIREQVIHWHHLLVEELFFSEKIQAPLYFLLQAEVETVDRWMIQKYPELSEVEERNRHKFITYEQTVFKDYFRKGTGQKCLPLQAGQYPLEELADQVCMHIISLVRNPSLFENPRLLLAA